MRDHIPFGFGTAISLDAKTRSLPQFIGAPQRNFETANLGIESLVALALGGWVNPSHTLFQPQRSSIIRGHPVPRSLQGALSAFRGRSSEGHNWELVRTIDEIFNATRR